MRGNAIKYKVLPGCLIKRTKALDGNYVVHFWGGKIWFNIVNVLQSDDWISSCNGGEWMVQINVSKFHVSYLAGRKIEVRGRLLFLFLSFSLFSLC